MTQLLLGAAVQTLNNGSLRGRCTITHDLRDCEKPRATFHETTTLLYPWVQGFVETYTMDPRLLQLKTFLAGRVRIRTGYAWGPATQQEIEQRRRAGIIEDEFNTAGEGDKDVKAGARPPRGAAVDNGGGGGVLHEVETAPDEKRGQQFPADAPVCRPPASALWDAPAQDGRPVGFMHEGPFSSDSFIFGLCLFGDDFKCADRLPASSQKNGSRNEQYCLVEHTLFRAWEGAFPDFNQPFDIPNGVVDSEGTLENAFPADNLFLDQLNRWKEDFGQPAIVLSRWYRRVDKDDPKSGEPWSEEDTGVTATLFRIWIFFHTALSMAAALIGAFFFALYSTARYAIVGWISSARG